jgi:hypothetical protein
MRHFPLVLLLLAGCPNPHPHPTPLPPPSWTTVVVTSGDPAVVNVAFGADSAIQAADWSAFCTGSGLVCTFPLTGSMTMPDVGGAYLNVTFSFNGPVGCGDTKAEVNVNNPAWYDVMDVSLVDGYSNRIEIAYTPPGGERVKLGPNAAGADGDNSQLLGVYPYGCDICVARQSPPCGIPAGGTGCKAGSQYDPAVACQYQGAVQGGGGLVEVGLLGAAL